jgi:hypothetical protein
MPAVLYEPLRDSGRIVIYEPPHTGPYKAVALVAVLLAAVIIGALTATITAHRC